MTFEELEKDCPWLHQPYVANPKVCRASSFVVRVTDKEFRQGGVNLACSKENCAIYYWMKAARIG